MSRLKTFIFIFFLSSCTAFIKENYATPIQLVGDSGGYLSGGDISKSYSTILAAFMSGKKIRPLYNINTGSTGWGMCTITSFYIQ